MCYQDPKTGTLSNHWITLHEIGNVTGFVPILVMDVWEHAFILDYAPADRPKYIDAFFSNVDWDAVQGRIVKATIATQTSTKQYPHVGLRRALLALNCRRWGVRQRSRRLRLVKREHRVVLIG